jgi:hypothetical protein
MVDARRRLDAAEALRGALDLSAAGRRLTAQRAGLGAEVAAASDARPWGYDEIGRAFENRYRPVEQQVLDAWELLAAYLESLGEAAARSVRNNLGDDAPAREASDSAYGGMR